MLRGWKLVYISTDFRNHAARRDPIYAGDGPQKHDLLLEGPAAFLNFLLEFRDRGIEEMQLVKEFINLKTMSFLKAAFECQLQFGNLVPQLGSGHIRKLGWLRDSID